MAEDNADPAVYAAQVKAQRAVARAEFLEARADLFEGVGPRHDNAILGLWEQATPTRRTT